LKREFYYQDDLSNKFWTIELTGNEYITTNGRVGAKARETRKTFTTNDDAQQAFNKQIASKLKKGYVEGKAPELYKIDWKALRMSEIVFWQIIGLFNWSKTGDDKAVIEPAIKALAQMTIADIKHFADIVSEKLYALDTKAHACEIGEDAWNPGKHFSGDLFLYARCCVIVNGHDFYESVLANPMKMPKDMEFESLLAVAESAYERKTGKEFDHFPLLSYESFSNQAGWPNWH
jgi:predicted DNA-binding WGR domain protein